MIKLTPEEERLVLHIRAVRADFCEIHLVCYVQDGKLLRAKAAHENVVESWMLKGKSGIIRSD